MSIIGEPLLQHLPAPEQPLPRPGTLKKPVPEPTPAPQTAEKLIVVTPPKPLLKPVAKVPTVKDVKAAKPPPPPPPPPQAPRPEAAPKPVAAPKPAAPKLAAAPKPAAVAAANPVLIPRSRSFLGQLAAARSQQGARDEWTRLRSKKLDLLGNLGLSVTKADLGKARGIFYRLRAGPLTDESSARALCRKLAERKIGCLIIKPGS